MSRRNSNQKSERMFEFLMSLCITSLFVYDLEVNDLLDKISNPGDSKLAKFNNYLGIPTGPTVFLSSILHQVVHAGRPLNTGRLQTQAYHGYRHWRLLEKRR